MSAALSATAYKARARRSRSEIDALRAALRAVVAEQKPMSVRQVFYQAVSRGIVDKTEDAYKNTVVRLLALMRRDGYLPFGWITDGTRYMQKPETWHDLDDALQNTARFYRRQLWANQPCYAEVWLEKQALAGVLYPVTSRYDVPLMVTRGYPSLSFLYEAAMAIREHAEEGKEIHLFYFGDHDPSGVDIPRRVKRDIAEFSGFDDFQLEVVAVNPSQIHALELPTRPTKQTDTRAKNFEGDSVEVDAIDPGTLRMLAGDCLDGLIDADALTATRRVEGLEKETLLRLAATQRAVTVNGEHDD